MKRASDPDPIPKVRLETLSGPDRCMPLALVVRGFCEPVWPSGKAFRLESFGSPFSSKVVFCGHCLVTLSGTIMKH